MFNLVNEKRFIHVKYQDYLIFNADGSLARTES